MLRYIILVFLLNTRFTSLGKSIDTISVNIGSSLGTLAGTCVNSFIEEQIAKKVHDCSINFQPHDEDYLRCLLFYDISKQLCEAAANNKLELLKEQIEELAKPMTVVSVCNSAPKWNVTNLPEYPQYKSKIDKITGTVVSCAVLCTEDPESLSAKFSCQYYNWGFNILNKKSQQLPIENKKNVTIPLSNINIPDTLKIASVVSGSEVNVVSNVQNVEQEHSQFSKTSDIKAQLKPEPSTVLVSIAPSNKPAEANLVPAVKEQVQTEIEKPKSVVPVISLHNSAVEKPILEEEKPPQKIDVENINIVKEIGENAKIKPMEGDDYPNAELESEEGKDGLGDTQGDDDGDGEPMPDIDIKMNNNQEKNIKKIDTSIAALQGDALSQREYVSNTFPEAFNTNDDHFFPIFLTSIVILVLLYVLYHNKNKVSKVVLGLIIEGRQSGRRRNSRGHAYRRLDTLEQAMSTNSSAPPSKIIY